MQYRHYCLGLTLAILSLTNAYADTPPIAVGDVIASFDISDQHGKPGVVDEGVRLLMFSRDMTANKLAKKAFMERASDYLPSSHAVYLIDVSGMPKFVTRHFAIPKMQKYPYRIFLDRDATLTASLPSHPEQVTLIRLDKLAITSIEYADSADALTRAVDAAAAQ